MLFYAAVDSVMLLERILVLIHSIESDGLISLLVIDLTDFMTIVDAICIAALLLRRTSLIIAISFE